MALQRSSKTREPVVDVSAYDRFVRGGAPFGFGRKMSPDKDEEIKYVVRGEEVRAPSDCDDIGQ